MSNTPILDLPIAVGLDGTEWSPLVQGTGSDATTKRAQISQITNIQGTLDQIGHTQGDILYRGATAWQALPAGTAGYVLATGGPSANPSWISGGGSGSVTSVGLSLPPIFSVSGSPVTTSGTLTGTLVTQAANKAFLGPASGADAQPTFRAIVNLDIAGAGAALTKTDDTNVTLTLGGSAATSLVNAASLTLGWTGQLAVPRGGTGLSTIAQGSILYASALDTISALAKTSTATRYITNQGGANSPAWGQVNLANGVTGNLPVTNLNSGTSASSSTFWRGDGTWATPSAAATSIAVGTTSVTGGTTTRVLYDNAGTLGEYVISGSGNVAMTTSPTFSTSMIVAGLSTGSATIVPQSAQGTPTLTLPNASGTFAVSATSPLSLSATTGALSITGSALTKTDDTNVTLTLGGTPASALLAAASLTLGWTGSLAVGRGGTGLTSLNQGDLLYASAANTLSALAKSATATRYLSNTGVTNNPAWAQIDLSNGVTGNLPVTNLNSGTSASSSTFWRGDGTWATPAGAGTVTSVDVSGGTTGLTTSGGPITGSGTITLAGTLGTGNGGTNLTTYAQGDLIYGSASNVLSKLTKDTNATRYLSNTGTSNNPAWAQINLANGVTGNLPVGNLNSGTSASSSTFWRGDGTWATPAGTGVSSITPGGGLTSTLTATAPGSAITTTGTLSGAELVNAQTGTTYTFVDGDRAKLVTLSNAAPVAVTLPQAGASSSFQAGWFVDVENKSALPAIITPTTSTIDGASSFSLGSNQGVRINSDGTNYSTQRGGSGAREMLTAARTYYVLTTGSDSNTGLANTAGAAFLTVQKAIDTVATLDIGNFNVTITVGAGTFSTSTGNQLKNLVGSGLVTISGAGATTIITTSGAMTTQNGNFYALALSGRWRLDAMKLTSTGTGTPFGVLSSASSNVIIGALEYGTGFNAQVRSVDNGYVIFDSNYTISGGAGIHIQSSGAVLRCDSLTVTVSGTPAYSTAFAQTSNGGIITAASMTYSGSATGVRYVSQLNGVINTSGGGASYFPGNSAGSTATGGQYA